jgi:putative transcriptional regulator
MGEYFMNKKEFATFLGMDDRQYNRYENSTVQPSLEVALKIANKLSKNVVEIWIAQQDSE